MKFQYENQILGTETAGMENNSLLSNMNANSDLEIIHIFTGPYWVELFPLKWYIVLQAIGHLRGGT